MCHYSGHFEITKADTVIEYLEMLFEIIVLGGVCAPIAEELTVRGLLMGYIERKRILPLPSLLHQYYSL